jgi:hypothetical protein
MRVIATALLALFAAQIAQQTAREYYEEIYAVGGLDRMADEYVCFDEDATNQNFFIFGQSKNLRQFMMENGTFEKLSKASQDNLKKDWLVVRGYAKGVPFDEEEFYDKDGNSWVIDAGKLDDKRTMQIRLTISWQTLRYKRAVDIYKPDLTLDGEVAHWGRCEHVKPDVKQTADP